MLRFEYSKVARTELLDIVDYTQSHWGDAQARKYVDSLEHAFTLLTRYPRMGRAFSSRFPKWRRFEYGRHIILYRPIEGGIRIERIVHERRLLDANFR